MKFIIIIVIFITLLVSDILVFDKEKLNDFLENIGKKSEKIYETIISK